MNKKGQTTLRSNEELARLAASPEVSQHMYVNTVKHQLDKAIDARQQKIVEHNERVSRKPLQTKRELTRSVGQTALAGGVAGALSGATVGGIAKLLTLPSQKLRKLPIASVAAGTGAVLGAGVLATIRAKKGRQPLDYIGYDKNLETLQYQREELKNPASPTYQYLVHHRTKVAGKNKAKDLGKTEKVFLAALSAGAIAGVVKAAPKMKIFLQDKGLGSLVRKATPGHAKELLLFGKRASARRKKKEPTLTGASFVPAATALGIGATGEKLQRDVKGMTKVIDEWDESLKAVRGAAGDKPFNFEQADEVFETYIKGGKRVANLPVLGVKGGRLTKAVAYAEEMIPVKAKNLAHKLKLRKEPAPEWQATHAKHRVKHYDYYIDTKKKSIDVPSVKSHMIEKAIGDPSMHGVIHNKDVFDRQAMSIVRDTKNYKTFREQHAALQRLGKTEAATHFRKAILGDAQQRIFNHLNVIGEAKRLAGNARDILSTPEVYKFQIAPGAEKVRRVAKVTGRAALAAGGILLAAPYIGKKLEKSAAKKDKSTVPSRTGAATMIGLGGALATKSLKDVIKPSKDIAVTYGTMPGIGEGHKAPGQAIEAILKSDPRLKKYKTTALVRDPHSIYRYSPKRHALLVDTGLGAEAPDWADAVKHTHGYASPGKVRAASKLRYLTDALKGGSDPSGFGSNVTWKTRGEKIIAYGPATERFKKEWPRMRPKVVSEGLTPALDAKSIKSIHEFDGNIGKVVDELVSMETVRLDQSKPKDVRHVQTNIDQLKGLKGKKLITVAGAGRGDYVASRAIEVNRSLKKSGLDKEYKVVALMANARKNVTSNLLKGEKDIVSLGFLPKDLYNKVQASSTVNWGVTGTSGLSEALQLKNVLALPKKWGADKDANVAPGSIAGRQSDLLREKKIDFNPKAINADLDTWNKGNIDYAHKQRGVVKADTADDIVNLLKDKPKLKVMQEEASLRAGAQRKQYKEGHKALADLLVREAKGGTRRIRVGGAIGASIGIGAAALGAKKLVKSFKEKEKIHITKEDIKAI